MRFPLMIFGQVKLLLFLVDEKFLTNQYKNQSYNQCILL